MDALSAAARFGQMVQASDARRAAEAGAQSDRWRPGASSFREDPHRENPTLTALGAFIEPNDVVLDVGGGAGRYLPLAARCNAFINVEPSEGMGVQFEAAVRDAGITNARWLHADWMDADITGDVTFVANVVYYVADIVPFLEKLHAASSRRVMIVMHSLPPVNVSAPIYRLIHGHDQPLDPGYHELLPVLWEMGILPDVRVLGPSDFIVARSRYEGPEQAIESALPSTLSPDERKRARVLVAEHFEEFFVTDADGTYRRRLPSPSRVMLVTWDTREN